MKRLSLALSVVVLLLLTVGVGTATADTLPTQDTGQLASSDQGATGAAGTAQQQPTNRNVSVRVLSPGDDGPVSQNNEASSDATAGNLNATHQDADQAQAGNGGLQTVGQSATSDQDAFALALTLQQGASNENTPVRVLSEGDNGPVSQTNDASSEATAGNTNVAEQDADQEQAGGSLCCGSDGSQTIGQSADSDQDAAALSGTVQEKPSNSNITVRVLSPGDNGPVTQTNQASSNATAANLNATKQKADQDQSGACPCGHGGTQVIGQKAESDQKAKAGALTVQHGAENKNVDVRVLSPGDNGPVTQSNVASSNAAAGNTNVTEQDADQEQTGSRLCCGSGTQIIGQAAKSDQDAAAFSATIQEKPSNTNTPIRVLSQGDNGPVSQSNVATSSAVAGNLNVTKQDADQAQAGSGLQVIGQAAYNEQDAFALGLTFQKGASNENAPVRVLSQGDDGPVSQLNHASSSALAGNTNWTEQKADQAQGGPNTKGCCGLGIQAIGQLAGSRQSAGALAATFQLGTKQPCRCKDDSGLGNTHDPVRVLSKGDGGPVRQANVATSTAHVANWNATKQKADQIQATPCLCLTEDIQAIGQLSESDQLGLGLATVLQLGGSGGHGHDTAKSPERSDAPQRKEVMHAIE